MKSSKEIIGLKVISIEDGTQLGTVKELVLNPAGGLLEFFMVDKQSDYIGDRAKVIAFKDIQGLGEYAVTIANPKVIQSISSNNQVLELIDQNVKVLGTKVLTVQGTITGVVKEVYFDEITGNIAQCSFETVDNEQKTILAASIVTYGKDLLIIKNDPHNGDPMINGQVQNKFISQSNWAPRITEPTEAANQDNVFNSATAFNQNATIDENAIDNNAVFNMFEKRQLEFIVGKKVSDNLTLDDGTTLFSGQTITSDTITKITTRKTLVAITSFLEQG